MDTQNVALSRQALITQMNEGYVPSFEFFWGHRNSAHVVTKSCMSQWFPASFEESGVHYSTAEHYMMAAKARLFNDFVNLENILKAKTPSEAKAFGRKVKDFDPQVWQEKAFQIVVNGNLLKFSQNDPLRRFLLATGQRVLVEASPVDNIWGIGLAADHPNAAKPEHWRGDNLLGFALMKARNHLLIEQ